MRRRNQIEAAYRRGYLASPQEPRLGKLGLKLLEPAEASEQDREPQATVIGFRRHAQG